MPPIRRAPQSQIRMAPAGRSRPATPAKPLAEPEHVLRQYMTWHEAEGHSRKTELDYQKTLRPSQCL